MAYTPGSGSVLQLSITAVFTTVLNQVSFGPFKRTRARIEVTGLIDTLEQLKGGIKRIAAVPFSGWWDPANATHAQLLTSYAATTTESWKAVMADAGAADITFSGFLSDLTIGDVVVDGYVQISGEITLTTDITVTP